jgi:flagellar hook-basal body complex protein FliE
MSIEAIGSVSSLGSLSSLAGLDGTTATAGSTGAAATSGTSSLFGTTLAGSVDQLQSLQATSDSLAVKAVTGDLDDIHDYTIAASQSAVSLELTAAIRNKAVEAFTEIMRMQA